jgi:hypothetical protein
MGKGPTSQRSGRQNLAQGGASAASGTLGNGPFFHQPALAGERICRLLKRAQEFYLARHPGLRFASLRFASLTLG